MPTPPDPNVPTRYAATSEDGIVHIWCREHVAEPILSISGTAEGRQHEIDEAMRDHDWEHHEEDRVV